MKLVYNPNPEETNNIDTPHTLQGENVREESKDQRSKMKDKPFKEKAAYYIGYYKFHALAVVLVTGILISLIYTFVTAKDNAFCAMMVNCILIDEKKIGEDFASYSNIDLEEFECIVSVDSNATSDANADAATNTRFAAMIASQDLDAFVGDSISFEQDALGEVFIDLREVLSEEDLNKHKDKIYYIDYAEIEKRNNSDEIIMFDDKTERTFEEQQANVKFHLNPDNLTTPIPVGIVVDDAPLITDTMAYPTTIPIFGIIVNSQRIDKSVDFLHYMYEENTDYSTLIRDSLY